MADAPQIPNEGETRARFGDFVWTAENDAQPEDVIHG
jgi:NADH-quinone oxidoreductase subunit E